MVPLKAMDFAERVKSSIDIVQVVGQRLTLRKTGVSRFTGLCPFHSDKRPSLSVHQAHQFYICFACGAKGDVFKFLMELEGLTFYEALKTLAEQHGIPLPKQSEYTDRDSRLRAVLMEAQEAAAEEFRKALRGPAGEAARAYIEKRGISSAMVEQFGLGYAPRAGRTLVTLLERRNLTPEEMKATGLVAARDDGGFYDFFRDRLMFPIHNEAGKVIAFGGRALDPGNPAKYKNSPETPVYKKTHVLYNLHRAKESIRSQDRTVLVEGYMDVIGVYAAGVKEVVASCGTALTQQQVQALRRHSLRIAVNFDPDTAGANAAERSIQMLLEQAMQVKVLELEEGLDPDEFARQRGAEAYRSRLEGAKSYFYWLADRARAKFDMRTGEGRIAAFQFLLPSVHKISDRLERLAIANDLASRGCHVQAGRRFPPGARRLDRGCIFATGGEGFTQAPGFGPGSPRPPDPGAPPDRGHRRDVERAHL
jgi:DNA primase